MMDIAEKSTAKPGKNLGINGAKFNDLKRWNLMAKNFDYNKFIFFPLCSTS